MESKQEFEALLGTVLDGKYRLEAVVGRGGFGVVYRALHLIWEQPVAVKVLTKLTAVAERQREGILGYFVREGRLLSDLSSVTTGIVQARDIGTMTDGGRWMPYMVLEWLEGQPLSRVLKREARAGGRTRSALEVFQIFDGVARALAIAHSRGVAHRDIKPPNIFVCGDALAPGVVIKLLDFGIAKVMQTHTSEALELTGQNPAIFTPYYGAPEQFNRKLGASGPWTDVFAMALVLLEVMRGVRTFTGESFGELALECIREDHRPTPRAFGVEVSDAVEAVFARAFAVALDARYRTMGEFWLALVEALEIEGYPPLPVAAGVDAGSSVVGFMEPSELFPVADYTGGSLGNLRALDSQSAERSAVTTGIRAVDTGLQAPAARGRRPSTGLLAGGGLAVCGVVGLMVFGTGSSGERSTAGPADGGERDLAAPTPTPTPAPEVSPPPPPCPEGMAHIKGGRFFMGSDDGDIAALALARPAHQVEVADFCLDRREVTVAAYRACSEVGECKRGHRDSWWPQGGTSKAEWKRQRDAHSPLCNGDDLGRAEHPVNCVTWEQADGYCRSAGKRLPREAEWEFAARGSDGRIFPWGDAPPSVSRLNGCGSECAAWRANAAVSETPTLYADDDGFPGTAPVGSFPEGATADGIFDIIGNVFEWTAEPYQSYAADSEPDPARRVIRGGAFNSFQPEHANPALRYPMAAEAHSHGIGFRCAADPRGEARERSTTG